MDNKVHHKDPGMLEKKYKDLKYNFCLYSLVGSIAAGSSAILSAKVDSGTEFYPRELRGHGWNTAIPATAGRFLISNIQLGISRNSLYGGGIYSDIFAKENAMPFAFTAYIAPARDIQITVNNLEAFDITVGLYLVGEAKFIG